MEDNTKGLQTNINTLNHAENVPQKTDIKFKTKLIN